MKTIPFLLAVLLCGAAQPPTTPATPRNPPAPNWQTSGGTGQAVTLAVSPLETISKLPGKRVLLSKQVGKWDAGDTHAAITALSVEAPTGEKARGLRIDLSRPGATETVYAEESVFPLLSEVLNIYTTHLPGPQSVGPRNPNGLLWNQFFDLNAGTIHPLAVAVFFDPAVNANGLALGRAPKFEGSKGMFSFPKVMPQDFATVVAAGIAAINAQAASLKELVKRPFRITRSEEVGRIVAGDTLAVFTALKVQDAAAADTTAVGIRVELSQPDARDQMYLDEQDISKVLAGLDDIIRGMQSEMFSRIGVGRGGDGEYGSSIFVKKGPDDPIVPPPLYASYFGRNGENGLKLATDTGAGGYYFPGKMPADARAAIEKGMSSLGP